MKTFDISLPEVAFVAATRGMAGAGIGLLLSEYFDSAAKRRRAAWTLLAIGILTTVPIALTVASRHRQALPAAPEDGV